MQLKFTYYKPEIAIPIIGFLWTASSWCLAKIWGYGFLQGIGPTTIVMLFLVLYDMWLWKLPVLNWMIKVPNLNGDYEGKISYFWDGQAGEKLCALVIKQSCSNIKVRCVFNKDGENETISFSTEAFIKTDEAGDQHLFIYYQNRGSCKNGDTLGQHDGMNVFEILREKKNIKLKGYYFTNRNPQTKGCIEVTKLIKGDK